MLLKQTKNEVNNIIVTTSFQILTYTSIVGAHIYHEIQKLTCD